jgi:hypothetical protein
MAYSYDFKHTADIKSEAREEASRTTSLGPVFKPGVLQMVAGFLLMGVLLLGSWSLDKLFMTELLTLTFLWGLISVIRIKSSTTK